VLQGTRTRRRRIPPFRRRELLSIYLAALVFGLVVPLLPPLGMPDVPIEVPAVIEPEPAPEPPPVQVQLVAPSPVVARTTLLNKLADSRTVALTFDDGPDPRWTPQILAILKRHGAVATFCMVGNNVKGHEALVKQVVDAGMRLCDHSRSHDEQLPDRDPERITDEVVGAESTLAAASGGAPVEWFRAPGGNWSVEVSELSAEHGMQPLSWNIDPRDWERPGTDAIVAAVQQQIAQQAPDGPIVLLHDGGGSREQTVEALEKLIPWLAEQGYKFGFPVP
jgi:peptidoglycan/xylan/chitin deacetylase (PgdA/CDA1 family)